MDIAGLNSFGGMEEEQQQVQSNSGIQMMMQQEVAYEAPSNQYPEEHYQMDMMAGFSGQPAEPPQMQEMPPINNDWAGEAFHASPSPQKIVPESPSIN